MAGLYQKHHSELAMIFPIWSSHITSTWPRYTRSSARKWGGDNSELQSVKLDLSFSFVGLSDGQYPSETSYRRCLDLLNPLESTNAVYVAAMLNVNVQKLLDIDALVGSAETPGITMERSYPRLYRRLQEYVVISSRMNGNWMRCGFWNEVDLEIKKIFIRFTSFGFDFDFSRAFCGSPRAYVEHFPKWKITYSSTVLFAPSHQL